MTKLEKQIVSFLVALIIPWVIAIIVGLIFDRELMLAIGLLLSFYTLLGGFNNNGEFDQSIGVFLGNVTDWIIPQGFSWWFPPPFGKSFKKTRVVGRELDRTRRSENQVLRVETSDGSQSEASLRPVYDIIDLSKWVSVEKPEETLSTTVSGFVRVFGLSFPASGDQSIANQKESLSKYLMGETVKDQKDRDIRSDITSVLKKTLGVQLTAVPVDDINPPQSIIDANTAAEREKAEAVQEDADTNTLIRQVERLIALGISPDNALTAAQAKRGDITGINVGGTGGDFTKGAALTRGPNKPSKKHGDEDKHGH